MDDRRLVSVSKSLSWALRHAAPRLGLTPAPGGWVNVDELLEALGRSSIAITRAELREVVDRNDKRRFSFDPGGDRIRANQGHSIRVDLQLAPRTPPSVLYHGTSLRRAARIQDEGLRRMSRHHVHLSTDIAAARLTGGRHGRPCVFSVDASAMHGSGHSFYLSANGVWLVDRVPPEFVALLQ